MGATPMRLPHEYWSLSTTIYNSILPQDKLNKTAKRTEQCMLGGMDGGSTCHLSILRKAPVAVSNLRNGCVAVSILGVHTHMLVYLNRT